MNISSHILINPENIEGILFDESKPSKRIGFTYMHGILQDDNGYDIFSICAPNVPTSTGIYPAKVLGRAEDDNEATFYLWTNGNLHTGLLVLNRDKDAVEYAEECYRKKLQSV